jgi:hypothetical protein
MVISGDAEGSSQFSTERHLVAADGHTSPGGIAIGHVEKNPGHPSRDALRVYRDVDGLIVDRAGVVEVFRD